MPAGVYSGHVVECYLKAFPWRKTTTNPDGTGVRIHVSTSDDNGPASVFDTIDLDNQHRLWDFCNAVGLERDGLTVEEIMRRAEGQPCRFTLKTIRPREGRNVGISKAVVAAWI